MCPDALSRLTACGWDASRPRRFIASFLNLITTPSNRFVGDYLLYGTGSGGMSLRKAYSNLYAVRFASARPQASLSRTE